MWYRCLFCCLCVSDQCRISKNNYCTSGAEIYVCVRPSHSQATDTISCQRWSTWKKTGDHNGTAGGTILFKIRSSFFSIRFPNYMNKDIKLNDRQLSSINCPNIMNNYSVEQYLIHEKEKLLTVHAFKIL